MHECRMNPATSERRAVWLDNRSPKAIQGAPLTLALSQGERGRATRGRSRGLGTDLWLAIGSGGVGESRRDGGQSAAFYGGRGAARAVPDAGLGRAAADAARVGTIVAELHGGGERAGGAVSAADAGPAGLRVQ